ncbi:SDR family oxidoreductase [Vibrio fluvialis]|uniref:SDR family oxidoreductase n=1 Tax=Vibrio fluvialis TaxID=676 RepID=UPI00192CD415|nr:aldehyde reductase [Vibrio fluvialis]MBL4238606.1 aldehyde reductase [Vibrio fluvialis]MBL4264246.1 aldehyde reductase [Vibrio fluvialis]MBL4269278.1 aldehyde reductase [Vibrio fluvialis]MBL4273588.1 aldehyde reductase [Vibrio fluvialis]MBO1439101.1 aldehyde reductase [Vibrio fluvialis]
MQQTVLVTGGTGFVATQVILQLLHQGYRVNTTVRSLGSQTQLFETLQDAGIQEIQDNLRLIEADLLDDNNWLSAMQNCDYVLHVASPLPVGDPNNEDDVIKPAVEGTLRVLTFAKKAGVKRVVMTSNFGAVGYSHTDTSQVITEQSWTNPKQKGLSVYNKSKVLAERAAWDYIHNEGKGLELTVINPMGIFGPLINQRLSAGHTLLRQLMSGEMHRLPDITMGIVDVRDVADLHIRAMLSPQAAGERFLALAGGTMSLMDIAHYLKEAMPQHSANISTKALPTWLLKVVAVFNPKARAIKPLVGVYRQASNQKARTMLGWQPRSNEQAVLAAAQSLVHYKLL